MIHLRVKHLVKQGLGASLWISMVGAAIKALKLTGCESGSAIFNKFKRPIKQD